ncbi:MAG: D-tyrosyl-tRNA(Tyr) deacylase [Acidimicrobiia bacterium]|nr:D-tyrosyl-tRNA(Tyr) deacylase [Acidimicrobiia bacterium]
MRAVVQRVTRAGVTVAGEEVGAIGAGLLALVGVTHDDDRAVAARLGDKLAHLRVLDDAAGVMNRSVLDAGAAVLVVSQFTLYGDTSRGRRPSWIAAARPEHAEPLVTAVVERLRDLGVEVATGRFRADMAVELVNDGPVTVVLDVA